MSELDSYLAAERDAVNVALHGALGPLLQDVPNEIADPIWYAVDAGGKRLRPVVCVATYRAAGGRGGVEVYDLACALELVHTYSLVHDDLPCMDDDDLRRGQPTVHRRFDERAAVLAGVAMIGLAFRALVRGAVAMGLAPSTQRNLVEALSEAAGAQGMVGGQVLDLEAEHRSGLGLVALEGVHAAKTGALFAASARLGALAAGAPESVVDAADGYGRALGLAFQVRDDVLDVTGNAAQLGKTAGRDEALGKATFASLLGADEAERRARAEAVRAVVELQRAGIEDAHLEALAEYAATRSR